MTTIEFVSHPQPPTMRNTLNGWVEMRHPEGFAHVKLPSGFNAVIPADRVDLDHPDWLIETAERWEHEYTGERPL